MPAPALPHTQKSLPDLAPAIAPIASLIELGGQLRAHRKRQGLRIDDAAALQGISVDLLSRLENGKTSVRTDKLLAVLDGLGLAVVIAPKDHPWVRRWGVSDSPGGDTGPFREAQREEAEGRAGE